MNGNLHQRKSTDGLAMGTFALRHALHVIAEQAQWAHGSSEQIAECGSPRTRTRSERVTGRDPGPTGRPVPPVHAS